MISKCVTVLLILLYIRGGSGHGRMIEPPSRSSMWRYGFDTPKNYDDTALNCGGYTIQWTNNSGKCGVCGDPFHLDRPNEAGGQYATGLLVRYYQIAETINITVELTANHQGWFEFRICANNDPTTAVTQECLDQNLLELADGSGTRVRITGDGNSGTEYITATVNLPAGMTCTQCVIQWKYNGGNYLGVDGDGNDCMGCGNQEQFYNCADVAIGVDTTTTTTTTTTTPTTTTADPALPCHGIGDFAAVGGMDRWCSANCSQGGSCPFDKCECRDR